MKAPVENKPPLAAMSRQLKKRLRRRAWALAICSYVRYAHALEQAVMSGELPASQIEVWEPKEPLPWADLMRVSAELLDGIDKCSATRLTPP